MRYRITIPRSHDYAITRLHHHTITLSHYHTIHDLFLSRQSTQLKPAPPERTLRLQIPLLRRVLCLLREEEIAQVDPTDSMEIARGLEPAGGDGIGPSRERD